MPSPNDSWYKEGLHFACTGCGKCCTGAPGYVFVTAEEIHVMSEHLGMTAESFIKRYVRRIGERYSLKETLPHFDCVFLKDKRCTIYPVRPKQCRTFPFWPQNLTSKESWKQTSESCEGICEEAPCVSFAEITHIQEE